ncbi:MAG: EAL domain-containing protein [Myxococcota bacterium]|nr:EAL domain-containing protein [Myxococcota bacterium]
MDTSSNRVLVVEDDELVRRAYHRVLSPQFDIVSAGTTDEAIAQIAKGRFGAIVSDIDMPGRSGIELLKLLRTSSPTIPVVLVTGSPSVESAQDAVNYGAFRYLTKPVEPEALRDAVTRATRLSKLGELHAKSREAIDEEQDDPQRRDLQARFERALDGLWMAFQPIVSWKGRRAIGYEALLRTTEASLMRPPDFIDAAEKLGRLSELGRRVRAKVAEAIPDAPPDTRIFVNLHARDLSDDELIDESSPLIRYADRVVLEVTERVSLEGIDDVVPRAIALRRAGFALAIDDLGAGYAGLSSLTQLEPEVVKLDMSLVRGIDQHRAKQQIVHSMVRVCADLGMEVVVEGVETPAERDALVRLGCDLLQGYHFAKPGPGFPEPRMPEEAAPTISAA